MGKNRVQGVPELLVHTMPSPATALSCLLGNEEDKHWGLKSRSSGETKGQECWQRMARVKMEKSEEVGDLLHFKISEVEYSRS